MRESGSKLGKGDKGQIFATYIHDGNLCWRPLEGRLKSFETPALVIEPFVRSRVGRDFFHIQRRVTQTYGLDLLLLFKARPIPPSSSRGGKLHGPLLRQDHTRRDLDCIE